MDDSLRTSTFSESQIVGILKEPETSAAVVASLGRRGLTRTVFCRYRNKYGGTSLPNVHQRPDGRLEQVPPLTSLPRHRLAREFAAGLFS